MIDFKDKIEDNNDFEFEEELEPKKKSWAFKISVFLFAFLLLFSVTSLMSSEMSSFLSDKMSFLGRVGSLVESSDKKLKGEEDDRINIVLLGMGGGSHEGGYLTDTIILASLKPSTKKVALMSIPRDLYISVEGMGRQKINAVNAFAEFKKEGSGGEAVSQAISDILDMPIHYYFRIDFEGFINVIDLLGGVEVDVENTLSDRRYPIAGREDHEDYYSRYQHLYVKKGLQEMNGSLALKYARSRHAGGIEGSDFARARRQQKIIQATKDKLLTMDNLFRPTVISGLISEFNKSIDFNFTIWEGIKMWQMFKNIESDDIENHVLDDGPNGLLVAGRNNIGSYILSPRGGDFTEIRYLISNFFPRDDVADLDSEIAQGAKIEIKNGTWINGLASQVSIDLEKRNFNVLRVSNSSKRDFQSSVIYDLSYGSKPDVLNYLRDFLQAEVSFNIPEWLVEDIRLNLGGNEGDVPDFLIILGEKGSRIGY